MGISKQGMKVLIIIILGLWPTFAAAQLTSTRDDGRMMSTRGALHHNFAMHKPRLTFSPTMSADSFAIWQDDMRHTMATLMHHPDTAGMESPRLVWAEPRDGYMLERWESYPLPGYVVPYFVLVPDGVDADNPAPASMLCIPGFGQTKELLAGELPDISEAQARNSQAQQYARQGYVAVAVDNPSFGELRDEDKADFLLSSRMLLEMGWSYLGLASFQDKVILDWLKQQPHTNPERIIVSGFSLGTEPLMALGLMDESIYAFVYNDFLCRTRERILVMTKPNDKGERPFPNSIEHLIPNFLMEFDFPDIVCALAPRPLICTEGGMDRDFDLVRKAYAIAGAPDNFTAHHYAKFADSNNRQPLDSLPLGIDRDEFFRLANVDPPQHYFKWEHVTPWLTTLNLGINKR